MGAVNDIFVIAVGKKKKKHEPQKSQKKVDRQQKSMSWTTYSMYCVRLRLYWNTKTKNQWKWKKLQLEETLTFVQFWVSSKSCFQLSTIYVQCRWKSEQMCFQIYPCASNNLVLCVCVNVFFSLVCAHALVLPASPHTSWEFLCSYCNHWLNSAGTPVSCDSLRDKNSRWIDGITKISQVYF